MAGLMHYTNKRKEEKMIALDGLKSIIMLNYLKDSMLDKLLSITSIEEYRVGDYILSLFPSHHSHQYSIMMSTLLR